jgi:multidrug efflux system outer membrane protein
VNRSAALILFAALLLDGCAGARYSRPDVQVPSSYRGVAQVPHAPGAADNAPGASLGELRWQDLIHDEELSNLIREALAHNYDAQIAAARVLEARGQLTVTRSGGFPLVNAQAGYNNLRISEDISGLPPGVF